MGSKSYNMLVAADGLNELVNQALTWVWAFAEHDSWANITESNQMRDRLIRKAVAS